jgi:hypothetical protein
MDRSAAQRLNERSAVERVALPILNNGQGWLQSNVNLQVGEDSGQWQATEVLLQEIIQAINSDAKLFINSVGHGRVEAYVNASFEQTNAQAEDDAVPECKASSD